VTIAAEGTHRQMDVDLFRAVLRRQATSVVVITAGGPSPVGFTATSFTSVSAAPPLVSFNLDRGSSSWPTVEAAEHVAVHLLGRHHEHLARRFSTSGIDRFAGTSWTPGPHGVPLLDDVPAWLVARVVHRVPAGDHAIVLAEPLLGAHAAQPHPPLVYHMGSYHSIDPLGT
jgi:flavin reductase (DIM6/NTAB) family NADH-FMN oxidoreductase RutF